MIQFRLSLTFLSTPVFPYSINHLNFHWSATHIEPQGLLYTYFLEGNDEAWSPLVEGNSGSYQNLRPGAYTFKLRAVGRDGKWSDTLNYPFVIRPPWWATIWAYLIYGLLIFGFIYLLYRYQLNRRLAAAEAIRLRELDTAKTRLYTNITHEFRTPLTIILGMAAEIKENNNARAMIIRNGRQLLSLVNQMLSLRRLEARTLQLEAVQGDVLPFLRYICQSFHSLAEAKNIKIQFISKLQALVMDHDPEKLRQLVSNLLANALKFSPENGRVSLYVEEKAGQLLLKVEDNGPGIQDKDIPYLFDRFYQVDDSATRRQGGTGIGLALVKELVELKKGTVEVWSKEGIGTVFTVRIPITREASEKSSPITPVLVEEDAWYTPLEGGEANGTGEDAPLALVVEDNADVAFFLHTCLSPKYQVVWAQDGEEGFGQAIERVPDIIISDVMMPGKKWL